MTRPLSQAAQVARYTGPRWLSKDAVLDEFIARRGWWPEDAYRALTDAIDQELLIEHPADGSVKRPRPTL